MTLDPKKHEFGRVAGTYLAGSTAELGGKINQYFCYNKCFSKLDFEVRNSLVNWHFLA